MADSDPYELAYQIDRLMRRMNAGLEARAPLFEKDRIGPIGGMVLLTLAEIQPVPMQRIVEVMARDKAQISRTLAMLERRELVAKSANKEDARSSLLSLTDKGAGFVEHIKATLDTVLSGILDPLSAEEQTQLLALLAKT